MSLLKTLWIGRRYTTPGKPARFVLRYIPTDAAGVTVGVLEYDGDIWTFKYDEQYKQRPELRPIEGLDDLRRTYRSSRLFPFFAVRIPDASRPDVKRELEQARVEDPDDTDLLRIFGRHVVSSPAFELVPA